MLICNLMSYLYSVYQFRIVYIIINSCYDLFTVNIVRDTDPKYEDSPKHGISNAIVCISSQFVPYFSCHFVTENLDIIFSVLFHMVYLFRFLM